MGFQTNFIAGSEVTISGDVDTALPKPSSDQTLKYGYLTLPDTNVNTVYTVTSGKTFYLMGFTATIGTAQTVYLYETDGSTEIFRTQVAANTTLVVNSAIPITSYASETFVKMKGSNTTMRVTVWGYEE